MKAYDKLKQGITCSAIWQASGETIPITLDYNTAFDLARDYHELRTALYNLTFDLARDYHELRTALYNLTFANDQAAWRHSTADLDYSAAAVEARRVLDGWTPTS